MIYATQLLLYVCRHPHQPVVDRDSEIGEQFKDEQNVKQMLTKWAETSTDGWEIAENWDSSNPYQDSSNHVRALPHSSGKTDWTRNASLPIEEILDASNPYRIALQQSPCVNS